MPSNFFKPVKKEEYQILLNGISYVVLLYLLGAPLAYTAFIVVVCMAILYGIGVMGGVFINRFGWEHENSRRQIIFLMFRT